MCHSLSVVDGMKDTVASFYWLSQVSVVIQPHTAGIVRSVREEASSRKYDHRRLEFGAGTLGITFRLFCRRKVAG